MTGPKVFFMSLDVESLFTNVPVDETLSVFGSLLDGDNSLATRTTLSVPEILRLCHLVMTSSYFHHHDGLFLQTDGVAMGNSLGPVAANLFMVSFERSVKEKALHAGVRFPCLWLRYVDDVLAFWNWPKSDLPELVHFLNNLKPSIKFQIEVEEDGKLPFLDLLIRRVSGSLRFSIHRKAAHTNRYLHRHSSHPEGVFKGLVQSLSKRAQMICSGEDLEKEKKLVVGSLQANGFSGAECRRWWPPSKPVRASAGREKKRFKGSIPYVPGTSEKIRRVLREAGIHVGLKPISTLRKQLVKKRPIPAKKFGVVYQLCCASEGCQWRYVGETGRTMENRRQEHIRAVRNLDVTRSEVAQHVHEESHQVDMDGMEVLDRERDWRKRTVKEALWTKKLSSSNRTKHVLSDFWTF